jgi:hypothetical protein
MLINQPMAMVQRAMPMQSRAITMQQRKQQQLQQHLEEPMLRWRHRCSCAGEVLLLLLLLLLVLQEPTEQQHTGEPAHSSCSSIIKRRGSVCQAVAHCARQQQASTAYPLLVQTRRTLAMTATGRQTAATLHQTIQI